MSLTSKEECQPIASGYLACVSRLRQTHSRLKKDPELLKEYANVIKQQQDLGIIERIAEKPGHDESAHYSTYHIMQLCVAKRVPRRFELCLIIIYNNNNNNNNLLIYKALKTIKFNILKRYHYKFK